MATIYPTTPEPGTPRSERLVFECLDAGLPPDWIVIHGRRFVLPRPNAHPDEGEIDFLVLDPRRGLLALEVRGGTVGRDAGGWYSIDFHGNRHDINDPGRQSQAAAHKIGHFVRESAPPLARLPFGWGVVFPDVDANGDLGPELPRQLLIDRRELGQPERSVTRVFEHAGVAGPPLDSSGVRAFTNVLLPRFQLVPSLEPLGRPSRPLGERIAEEGQELVRLTEEQMRILEYSGHLTRLAVEGAAGTGKTLVALEQARRLAADGRRVLLLCYNRQLAEALSREAAAGLLVTNFHGLCRDLALEAGLEFRPSQGDEEFWNVTAPDLLLEALELLPDRRWDAVIVDEGQDFAEHWWIVVQTLLARPEDGTLWVFHDPAQNIFGREPWAEIDRMPPIRLPRNCRNTKAIGRHAYAPLELEPAFPPGAPEGVEVRDITCPDERAMLDEVRKAIHRLLVEERVDPASVVVLSTRAEHASAVWRKRRFGNYELAPFPATGSNQVGFATLQRFKELEADAVILCGIAPGEPHSTPNHTYVGASRARPALVVLRYA